MKGKDKESGQESGSNIDVPRKNIFYSLPSRGEHESSPDMVTGMLQVFSLKIYTLIYLGATLSFNTSLVVRNFLFCLYLQ